MEKYFIYTYLLRKLSVLNKYIDMVVDNFRPELRPMMKYALKNGQRLRPLLLISGYEVSGNIMKDEKYVLKIAAALEFLHKASLAHDDIVDEDNYRRGEESIPGKFGTKKALIIGDLLIAGSYKLLNSIFSDIPQDTAVRCMECFNEIFFRLSQGEMTDILYEERDEISEKECMELMDDKTAIFIQNALVIGGILGEVGRETEDLLREYGKNLGMAFQLINDLNNCNGLERDLKRNFATDICQGKKNILLLKVLEDKSGELYGKAIEFLCGNRSEREAEELIKLIMGNGVVGKIKDKINKFLSECQEIAVKLPECPSKKVLEYIPKNAYKKAFWENKKLPEKNFK